MRTSFILEYIPMTKTFNLQRYTTKILIVALIIVAGIILHGFGLLDHQKLLNLARGHSDHWWLVAGLILLQIILYTFALTGSIVLWIAAPLYQPEMATLILTAGGTIGGMTAYLFSRRLTHDLENRIENTHVYKLIHKQNNFFTSFALRVFPGFPHSFINYSSGIFNTRFSHFIPATILGFSIKYYIYSKAIYSATSAASVEDLLGFDTYGPLIILSAFILAGVLIKFKIRKTETILSNK